MLCVALACGRIDASQPDADKHFKVLDRILVRCDDGEVWDQATVTMVNEPGVSYKIVYDDGDTVSICATLARSRLCFMRVIILTPNTGS